MLTAGGKCGKVTSQILLFSVTFAVIDFGIFAKLIMNVSWLTIEILFHADFSFVL